MTKYQMKGSFAYFVTLIFKKIKRVRPIQKWAAKAMTETAVQTGGRHMGETGYTKFNGERGVRECPNNIISYGRKKVVID